MCLGSRFTFALTKGGLLYSWGRSPLQMTPTLTAFRATASIANACSDPLQARTTSSVSVATQAPRALSPIQSWSVSASATRAWCVWRHVEITALLLCATGRFFHGGRHVPAAYVVLPVVQTAVRTYRATKASLRLRRIPCRCQPTCTTSLRPCTSSPWLAATISAWRSHRRASSGVHPS